MLDTKTPFPFIVDGKQAAAIDVSPQLLFPEQFAIAVEILLISEARIDRVYFGAYDEKKGSLDSIMKIYKNKNIFVPEVYGGINEEICSSLIKNFFKEKRVTK